MAVGYSALVVLVGLERIFELWISRRHAAWAFARGGIEGGLGHWMPMRVLHTAWLLGCLCEPLLAPRAAPPVQMAVLGAGVLLTQALRYWAVLSLGPYWNTRVIVVPGAHAVVRGPYRFLRHPNYVAVVLEGLALPLMANAYLTAAAFFVLNAWLLRVRIHSEERLLRTHVRGYGAVGQS